jgi:hypothetical protein
VFIELPDPHPGRCQNYRMMRDANGYPASVRCLEYEGFPHVCRFPQPVLKIGVGSTDVCYSADMHPQKWIRPEA